MPTRKNRLRRLKEAAKRRAMVIQLRDASMEAFSQMAVVALFSIEAIAVRKVATDRAGESSKEEPRSFFYGSPQQGMM